MADPFEPLLEDGVDPDPLVQFGRWFDDAATVVASPEAMAVATVDPDGHPSVRMVLLKAWGADGFVFHTNFDSRKGHELAVNPHASLLFYWEPRGRQVRIEGTVERTDDLESDAYFTTRPPGGQIGAHASHQSQPIADRSMLDRRVEEVKARYAGGPVPRPPWWGGLRVRPQGYEFWQNREDRLHDRLRYTPDGGGWRITHLQP
jgi:pyridoxamine 5'-phosphate oxidase